MLHVVRYPVTTLNEPSELISAFDESLKKLAESMHETMIRENGIGLAAPQIGKNIRLIIVKVGDEGNDYRAYVNPEIVFSSDKTVAIEEGCLSLPGVFGYVQRASKIRFTYRDLDGKKQSGKARGMEAIVLQHEIDHINGSLIINRTFQVTQGMERLALWQKKQAQ
ncbi:MAG: peptide deformylase [Candidatus Komeilibacteria bacterium]|nr:peptide deformylase [Candidatus Komeilibacteria bacterium]